MPARPRERRSRLVTVAQTGLVAVVLTLVGGLITEGVLSLMQKQRAARQQDDEEYTTDKPSSQAKPTQATPTVEDLDDLVKTWAQKNPGNDADYVVPLSTLEHVF